MARAVSRLDAYDTEDLVKWHHFAFRADATRVGELRRALEPWVTWRERAELERFYTRHIGAYLRDEAAAVIDVDRGIFAPLVEHAAEVGVDPAVVQARIATLGTRLPRTLHAQIASFSHRLERLQRLRELKAPVEVVDGEIEIMRDTLALGRTPVIEEPADPARYDLRYLFEAAIELTVGDPWADNVGFGRLYGVLADELPLASATRLEDPAWPVHHENLDRGEPLIYGFDGFSIGIVAEVADSLDELVAYEPSEPLLRGFALDRVCRELEDAGADLQDDDDDELDYDQLRHRAAERLAPDRVRVAIGEVDAEWRARKTAAVAAYRDVAANRCMLLQWEAKNPAL